VYLLLGLLLGLLGLLLLGFWLFYYNNFRIGS
jgi:hypothetical protein